MKILRPPAGTECSAQFSECGKYRYCLTRDWDRSKPALMVVGLNPSTADHNYDDPTIAKLQRYAKSWGYGRLWMLNLFAWRDTDPKNMLKVPRPIGEHNDSHLRETAAYAALILCAWGAYGKHMSRGLQVTAMLQKIKSLHVLKLTDSGHPHHPLYLPETLTPQAWGGWA